MESSADCSKSKLPKKRKKTDAKLGRRSKNNFCQPESKCLIRAIKDFIINDDISSASEHLANLCSYSKDNEIEIHKLAISIIEKLPNKHELFPKYFDIMKEICIKEPLRSFIFWEEFIQMINSGCDLAHLHLHIQTRLMQRNQNKMESIICGLIEYTLNKSTDGQDTSMISKILDHLSILLDFNPKFPPYFEVYFKTLEEAGQTDHLNLILRNLIQENPSDKFFLKAYVKYFQGTDDEILIQVLNKISQIDPLDEDVTCLLLPYLQKENTIELIRLLFERLEYNSNYQNLDDLRLLLKCIKKQSKNDISELEDIYKNNKTLWTQYNDLLTQSTQNELEDVKNIRSKISSYMLKID